MAEHWLEALARDEWGLDVPQARAAREYTDADFEIKDPTRVQESARKAIEKLAAAQDMQPEGGRAHNLWPRAEMAFRIAAGSDIPDEYVADRFRQAAVRCGMDTDVKNGGMKNVEDTLRNAHRRSQENGPLPPAQYADAEGNLLPQFDLEELLGGPVAPGMAPPGDTPEHSEAVEPPKRVLEAIEDGFWEARPSLQLVYAASLAQLASPWAVLACCVARVLARVPPDVKLPPIIGGPGSLNWFAAIVAKSGGGKGAAMAVSEQLVRGDDITVRSIGSGEGMIECYNRRRPKKDEALEEAMADWTTSVLFNIEEIDNLGAMGSRTGQTTMGILRQGFSGEKLGFSYRGRQGEAVNSHTYRMTVVASVQPERAGTLFEDQGGGTPQRFMWFPAADRRITKDPPPWPEDPMFGPKHLSVPPPQPTGKYIEVPDVAADAIRTARVQAMRGDENALDGHALFCREKFAYALALLDGRTYISEEDWELSGTAAAVSDWCRNRAREGYAKGKERVSRERGELRALEDDERGLVLSEVARKHTVRVAGWVVQQLERGPMTEGDLRRGMASRDRARLSAALEALKQQELIEADGRGWKLAVSKP